MKFQKTEKFKEAIEKTYNNCVLNYIRIKNKIIPFFLVKSKIFGNRMINSPFLNSGFIPKNLSEKDIKKIIRTFKGKKIEIRMDESFENFENIRKNLIKSGFGAENNKYQMTIFLKPEKEMWKSFHKHTRNDIRKAQKSGLKIKNMALDKELKKFYKLYFKNMKFFGTPQHSYKFFKNLFEIMEKNVIGFNCYYGSALAGSIIMFYEERQGYIAFNVSNPKYRKYRPNDLLYWEMIRFAIEKKLKKIDLGQVDPESDDPRTKGLYKFKRKWLSIPIKRIYFLYPKEKSLLKKSKKEKLKKLRIAWRRLPSPIIKIIGPKIAAQLAI